MLVLLITGILPLTFRTIKYNWRICFDGSFLFLFVRLFLFDLSLLRFGKRRVPKVVDAGFYCRQPFICGRTAQLRDVKIECSTKLPKLDEP